jgi:tetratricopeptide (TPR) repeat protein
MTGCEEAVAVHREALKEYTRERAPLDWAMTQNNLGIALRASGERESGTGRLELAVKAFQDALQMFETAAASHYAQVARQNIDRVEKLLVQGRM